ncbi:hypothetical protein DF185_04010 [Marinifilum breve]|uniref:HTH araC/xylS-type domain-containing protein n=1 Tax=Marinifilum breve TaxID=2184082 RepID=A0A2V3ZZA3_9BACT|nr:AraC family transcriptional regulator [Marinifilum breve]PXY01822.1 hypothetical protein DF185_04010 [Marinifilum breve]
MTRFKQHIPFVVLEFEGDIWDYPPHNHDHFEIILIKKGIGRHIINEVPFQYKADDIFLIAPNDFHYFEVDERTSFCYLKFTDLIFKKDGNIQEKAKWMQRIESVLFNPNLIPGDVRYNEDDKKRILHIAEIILDEHHNPRNYSTEIISDAVSMILSIIARNICNLYCEKQVKAEANKGKINEILTYIRHHVYDPEKTRIEVIAEQFHMSKNYISIFFKKHAGESLQQYILNYRMTLAENRIRLSDFTISEIAFQLGFTDESHLIRHFKKRYGVNPGEYRKTLAGLHDG